MKFSIITSIAMTAFGSFALAANMPEAILRRQYGEPAYGSGGESAPAPAPAPAPEAPASSSSGY